MLNLIDTALKSPLARILTWPHSPESYLEFLAPEVGGQAVKATVKALRQETRRAVSLVLQPNHRWQGHVPGQYVSLTVSLNGRRHSRCFTVSGAEQGCPVVTIQSQAGGVVSGWANEAVRVGDSVELSAATGDFVLPARRPDRLLFIAGGSGITPIRALTDQLVAEGHAGPVDILYYVPTRQDAIFLAHLGAVAGAHPHVRLHLVETRDSRSRMGGHFTAAHLQAIGADASASTAYVCGPAPLIAAVEQHWQAAGRRHRLVLERFRAATAPVAPGAEAVAVEFRESAVTTTAPGRTLLEAAEGAGLAPTSGCRQGICRTCTCRKLVGRVRDLRTGEISGDGEEDIALCVSVPVTPVTLDL